MIRNRLKIAVVGLLMTLTSLSADNYFDGTSLAGIEGSYGAMNSELSYAANPAAYNQKMTDLAGLGIKIGAESESYRIFLSGRYYADMRDEYEYIATVGGEVQYIFHNTAKNNIFIGVGAGLANMKFAIEVESFSRTLSDPYIGGDIGMNFHMRKYLDLEMGVRVISIQAENSRNNVTYRLNTIANAYASIIYKWQMD